MIVIYFIFRDSTKTGPIFTHDYLDKSLRWDTKAEPMQDWSECLHL